MMMVHQPQAESGCKKNREVGEVPREPRTPGVTIIAEEVVPVKPFGWWQPAYAVLWHVIRAPETVDFRELYRYATV